MILHVKVPDLTGPAHCFYGANQTIDRILKQFCRILISELEIGHCVLIRGVYYRRATHPEIIHRFISSFPKIAHS